MIDEEALGGRKGSPTMVRVPGETLTVLLMGRGLLAAPVFLFTSHTEEVEPRLAQS